jgi:hypothetical protein
MRTWIVESLEDDGSWDPLGVIVAPTADAAVTMAAQAWPDVGDCELHAIAWDHASADKQSIATYENNIRLEMRRIGAYGAPSDASADAASLLGASDPADQVRKSQRIGFIVAAGVVVGLVLLFAVARPSAPTFALCLLIAAAGAWASFRRARLGLLETRHPPPSANVSFGFPAVLLGGCVLYAVFKGSLVAAFAYVLFFFLGAMVGIVMNEVSAKRR